jgi:two-component sensor histidine kinase
VSKQKLSTDNLYFEEAKYIVTRNLFAILAVILMVLGIINFIQGDINMIPTLAGGAVSALVLLILYQTKKYQIAAIVAVLLSTLLTIYNLLVTSDFGHFVDFFWIAIMSLYVFFTLGKKWGVFNLFVNIGVVVVIFYLVRVGEIKQYPKELTSFSQTNFIINISIAGIIFSYMVILMINQMRLAQERYVSANAELTVINEEKTVMMKEIHHRVKNNLQVVMSLLRLQANEIVDQRTKYHLTDSVNRISAMAMIHEKMYQSETLTKIDLKGYLQSLVQDLITSYADKTKIEVDIESELDRIEPKSIVPVALIFNELVSNSIKHGFKNREIGKIVIHVTRNADGSIQLDYSDNGTWADPEKSNGFGLEMIEIFTEQLDGSVERKIDHGTHYSFNFPAIL